VWCLGELPEPQALAVVQVSDVFVRPTFADGDAISVREALALGVRCVASDAAVRPNGVRCFRRGDATDLERVLGDALAAPANAPVRFDAGPALLHLYGEMAAEEGLRESAGAAA
jgi:hypothetical protein